MARDSGQDRCAPYSLGLKAFEVEDRRKLPGISREIRIPESWRGQRIFLVIGACDWETQAWLGWQTTRSAPGGIHLLSLNWRKRLRAGHRLVLRVDDTVALLSSKESRATGTRVEFGKLFIWKPAQEFPAVNPL